MKLEHSYKGVNIYSIDNCWVMVAGTSTFIQDPSKYGITTREGQIKLAEWAIDTKEKVVSQLFEGKSLEETITEYKKWTTKEN